MSWALLRLAIALLLGHCACEDYPRSVLPPASPYSSTSGMSSLISWEFESPGETLGWGTMGTEDMGADVYVESGEMRIDVQNDEPRVDSGRMFVKVHDRATLALRYKYSGPSNVGKFLLRGSSSDTAPLNDDPPTVDISSISWDPSTAPATDEFAEVYFPIVGDGRWRTTYAPFQVESVDPTQPAGSKPLVRVFNSTLTQVRLYPIIGRSSGSGYPNSPAPIKGASMHIDWIRLSNAPAVTRVTGCNGEQYSSTATFIDTVFEVEEVEDAINGVLVKRSTSWKRRRAATNADRSTTFGRSYNCMREGGDIITIEGRNFGEGGVDGKGSPAVVLIGSLPCTSVAHSTSSPQTSLTCVTPAMTSSTSSPPSVQVLNGVLPGLNDTVPYFEYAVHPPVPIDLTASNNAATSIDLSWKPGGSIWDAMAVTGYAIYWYAADSSLEENRRQVVGNVTTTTIRGLESDTTYNFVISAVTEDQNDPQWLELDKYGRRSLVSGGLIGAKSSPVSSRTLEYDISFLSFTADSTLNYGPSSGSVSTTGPTGVSGGEGSHGIVLVGDANVENCNSSVVCCDGYVDSVGSSSCGTTMMCSESMTRESEWVSGSSSRPTPNNLPGGDKRVDASNTISKKGMMKCGPALRLTASSPRLVGAAWYGREMEVGEGFDTTFKFRVANPSLRCNFEDGVQTGCRSRGADGFAFVIQESGNVAIGGMGRDLGYGGIVNSIAVEFDTYFNAEVFDPYENHVSVNTRGWREENSANQTYSLGHSSEVMDLTDGEISVRIRYSPNLEASSLYDPSFTSFPYVSHFLENADFANGGMADWGTGMGIMQVYVGDLFSPILTVPLSIESTLSLNHGRSWVGFTSATGLNSWQVHDILSWNFVSLREDIEGVEGVTVNGGGNHECSGVDDVNLCVHK